MGDATGQEGDRESPETIRLTVWSCKQPKKVEADADLDSTWIEFLNKAGIEGFNAQDNIICNLGYPMDSPKYRKAELTEKIRPFMNGWTVKKDQYSIRITTKYPTGPGNYIRKPRTARRSRAKLRRKTAGVNTRALCYEEWDSSPRLVKRRRGRSGTAKKKPIRQSPNSTQTQNVTLEQRGPQRSPLVYDFAPPPPRPNGPVHLASVRPFGGTNQELVNANPRRPVPNEKIRQPNRKAVLQERLGPVRNTLLLKIADEIKSLQDRNLWERNVTLAPYSSLFLQELLDV